MTPIVGWSLAALALVATVAALVFWRRLSRPRGAVDYEVKDQVDVRVLTDEDGFVVEIDPYVVNVHPNTPLKWVLHSDNPGHRMRILPKDTDRWPYPNLPTEAKPPHQPIPAGPAKGDAELKVPHGYSVKLTGPGLRLTIGRSPEVIIWPR